MTGASGFTERAFNVAVGLSLLTWTCRRVWHTVDSTPLSPFDVVQLLLAAMAILVALLIMARAPVEREGSWRAVGLALPTIGIGAVVFNGVSPASWSPASVVILALGELLAILAFLNLGKSFAVLPSVRRVITRGPYQWVRHPAYAGELVMLAACVVAERSAILLAIWLAAGLLIVPRILAEERLLLRERELFELPETSQIPADPRTLVNRLRPASPQRKSARSQ